MSARSRKELLEQARASYRFRGKEGRSRLLDELCALCGYERKYVIKVLGGKRPLAGERGLRRGGSVPRYGPAEREVLKAIWLCAEQPCGKRLEATVPIWLAHYEKRHGRLSALLRHNLLSISPATID